MYVPLYVLSLNKPFIQRLELLHHHLYELHDAQPQPEAHGAPQGRQVGGPVEGGKWGSVKTDGLIKWDGQVTPVRRRPLLRDFISCNLGGQT